MTGTRPLFLATVTAAILCGALPANAQNTTPRMSSNTPQSFHHKIEIPNNTARQNNANNEDTFSGLQKKMTRAERQKARQDRTRKNRGQDDAPAQEESRTASDNANMDARRPGRRERQGRHANRQTRAEEARLLEKGAKTLSKYLND